MVIYKDKFRIKINGELYKEGINEFFSIEDLRRIYVDNIYHTMNKLEIIYDPILVEDILTEEEIYDYGNEEN